MNASTTIADARLLMKQLQRIEALNHQPSSGMSTLPDIEDVKFDDSDVDTVLAQSAPIHKNLSAASQSKRALLLAATVDAGSRRLGNSRKGRKNVRGRTRKSGSTMGLDGPVERSITAFGLQSNRKPIVRTVVLRYAAQLQASAGGVLANVIGNDPSVASGWASWASTYEEFRVLKVTCDFQPFNKYDLAATAFASPVVIANDYNASGALSSYAQGVEYERITWANTSDQFQHELATPTVAPYENWISTIAPINTAYMKFYSNALGNLQNVGFALILFHVQFMGMD